MKKNIFKTIAMVSLVCLLPACSSNDDDEMFERQSQNGISLLRKSTEAQPVLVCSGSATKPKGNVTVSAVWSLYKAPEGSVVQPKGTVSITGSASDGSMCMTKNLEYHWNGTSVHATATIEVTSISGGDYSIGVSLEANNGTGSLSLS